LAGVVPLEKATKCNWRQQISNGGDLLPLGLNQTSRGIFNREVSRVKIGNDFSRWW